MWHCSIRTHPTDPVLTDAQWAHIATEVMAAVGLAPHGDTRAVRWVAVRHAEDHIHLVATRVRQDRRTAWTSYDKRKAQAACRRLEEELGLYRVAPAGHGSRRWPGPAELNKTARLAAAGRASRTTPRDQLRRAVRAAAVAAFDETDFFERLGRDGVLVRLRHSTVDPSAVTGYSVGLPGHTTAAGGTVWYGGGRLAPDLTLPRLRSRWTGTSGQDTPRARLTAAQIAAQGTIPVDLAERMASVVRDAVTAMRSTRDFAAAATIAGAAADLLFTAARAWEGRGGGPLTDAADHFDRAAYEARAHVPARPVPAAGGLGAMSRLIAVMGRLSRDRDTVMMLHLIRALAGLADALAELRQAQARLNQARVAREAARRLRASVSLFIAEDSRIGRAGQNRNTRLGHPEAVGADHRRGSHRRR
ncbi:relaxase/mobilization nuclease domain-containing protein [Virgisporangium aurantiacum]|uniref:relaxase/mobilization nuclease domain-containing protein n=1 Tax=Virgisporangium aurantiacum TaxID=175570 RepID=UPI00357167B7